MARLRLFPLNTVLFPGAVLNLHIFEPRYRTMIAECIERGEAFGVCLIRDGDEAGDPDVTPHEVGTTAEIADVTPLPAGRYYITTHGRRRFRITGVVSRDPYILCDVEYLEDEPGEEDALDDLVRDVSAAYSEYVRLSVDIGGVAGETDVPGDPLRASYRIGDGLHVAESLKQRLLEARTARQRLTTEAQFLRRLLPQLRALRQRKATRRPDVRKAPAPGGAWRVEQEKFFGKYFSAN